MNILNDAQDEKWTRDHHGLMRQAGEQRESTSVIRHVLTGKSSNVLPGFLVSDRIHILNG
jgi:hypothetical protein